MGPRNVVNWTKGTFLRFLGILIHFAVCPLPNYTWHWRWPDDIPASSAPAFPVRSVMSEFTFKRYWVYMALPGFLGGGGEDEEPGDPA